MKNFEVAELELAQKAMESTISKNKKVLETLNLKIPPRPSQIKNVDKNLKVLYIASSLIAIEQGENVAADYTEEDLIGATQILLSLVKQIEGILPKFKEGTSQHTLAIRRIRAFQIGLSLIEARLRERKH